MKLRSTAWLRAPLLVAAGLLAHPAHAQIAAVQSSGLFGNPAGITATSPAFSANPKVGNTLVVMVWTWTENTAATINVTDSAGNTYTTVAQATIDQSAWFESAAVYYARVAATGPGFTVTVTMPNNDGESQSRVVAMEYSGLGALDQYATATGSAATASVATPAALAQPNELIVSAMGVDNPADAFSSITPSAGYTARGVELQNAGDTAGGAADQIAASAAAQSITWTTNPGLSGWAAIIATFKPALNAVPKSSWHFDESVWPGTAGAVIDSSGNGYNGTAMHSAMTSGTTPAIAGSPGTCRYGTFDGATQYVAAGGPHLTGPFTVTAWIRPTASSSTGAGSGSTIRISTAMRSATATAALPTRCASTFDIRQPPGPRGTFS